MEKAELDEPPDSQIERFLDKGESILFKFKSDLKEDGTFGERLLVITNKRVLTYTPSTDHLESYEIDKIREIKVFDYLGNGELELELIDGRAISLIRFTRVKTADFRKAATLIEEIAVKGIRIEETAVKELEAEQEKYGKLAKRYVMVKLLKFLKPCWHLGVATFILSLLAVGLGLVPPYLMKILIDEALGQNNVQLLIQSSLCLIGVYFFAMVVGVARRYLLAYMGEKIIYAIRTQLFEHVQRLSLGFHDKYGSGRLISRITDDTSRINWFLTWGVQSFIISILQMVGIGMVVFTMNPSLALFALLPVPFVFLGITYFRKKAGRVYHKAWRRWADLSSLLVDTIPGIIVVKAFSQEEKHIKRFTSLLSEVVRANLETVKLRLEIFPLLGFVTSVGSVLIWWLGGLKVVSGEITLGMLTAFVSYMWQFYGPVNTISTLIEPLQTAITSGERIFELLESKPEVEEGNDAVDFEIEGHIKFENVYFGYEPYVYVLQGVSFEVKPGEVVGIVGPSGSGKTTLTKLLLRFYNPDKGRILIDGVDIRRIKLDSLRRQIGIVLQDPVLFSGTIAENISYGVMNAEPEEIIAAAKAAHAHDFIMKFPTAYDTYVGERGSRLSGGERQRIAIARVILTNPRILVLDEATSSVDTITERQIQAALNNLVKGRTTIVIAHRLSTIKNADKIIVINRGQIVEVGKHEELLARNGLYKRLWQAQFEEKERAKRERIQLA